MTFYDFKSIVLGLRYEIPTEEENKKYQELYSSFVSDLEWMKTNIIPTQTDSSSVISFTTKDQIVKDTAPVIVENPLEIDIRLAYTGVLTKCRPELLGKIQKFIDVSSNSTDFLVRRMNKFLINYSIGLLFKEDKHLAKTARQIVNSDLDLFLKKHKVYNYILFKKRDGVVLDLPKTFILDNLLTDDKFKVDKYKIAICDSSDLKKQLYLTNNSKVIAKGIGDAPPGMIHIVYGKLLNDVLTYKNSRSLDRYLDIFIRWFLSCKNPLVFSEPGINQYIFNMKDGITIKVDSPSKFNMVGTDFNYEYYYIKYIDNWIKSLVTSTN